MLAIGLSITRREEVPFRVANGGTGQAAETHSRVTHFPALLPNSLALVVRHRRKELLKSGVARVLPMKLHRMPQQEVGIHPFGTLCCGWKQDVQRGHVFLVRERQCRAQKDRSVCRRDGEQPRAGARCERDGRDQLGVIVQPVSLIGLCPCPIKHILAIGVPLEIQGQGTGQRAFSRQVSPKEQEQRPPARLRRGTSGIDHRLQPRPIQSGVGAGKRIPDIR